MKTKLNKIDNFFELSAEAYESDNEFIYNELGVSKDDYLDKRLKKMKQLKLKSKIQSNKAKNTNALEMALQKVQDIVKSKNDNWKESLERVILSRSPQFQFRNIEKLDADDLIELLSDIDIIEIIEDIEKLNNANK